MSLSRDKKIIIALCAALVAAFVVLTAMTRSPEIPEVEPPVQGGAEDFVLLDNITQSATNTAVGTAVKLLSRNYSRTYCVIVNDSDTAVYLTFKNFSDANAASTSVGVANGGIRLNANGGSYECLPPNMIITDVWASSTASGKRILIGEN